MIKQAPPVWLSSRVIVPSWAVTIELTIVRPRPVPAFFVEK